ncbi:ComEC/Rec2 family competence protein [Devosia albogilva]|uniref:ComEC/Rec2 family competence protein n=1 Tax=Devosia albogilva TaxID=429726 RepID=A0ABW5QP93_9HYPH
MAPAAAWLWQRLAKAPVLPGATSRHRGLSGAILFALEARRTFVLVPFAMVAGLIVYAGLPSEPMQPALMAGMMLLLSVAGLLRHRALVHIAVLACFAWFGAALLPLHGALFGTAMLERPAFGTFTAHVDEVISANAEERRIVVSALQPEADTRSVDIRRARLLVPPEPPLAPGDTIRATLRLAPIPGPVLPGSYDGQFHSYFAGIGAYGTVTGGFFERVASGTGWDATRATESLRLAIGARIDAVLDADAGAIARAMIMGDQSAITDETRDVMAAAGLAHIYSISGLHLAIVAGGIYFLIRLLLAAIPAAAVHLPIKRIAAVAGILAAVGYLLLAGGLNNVPALRSTIMLALVFGAVLAGRQALTMRNVAIAAILIIVLDPASVFRPSFQLSFAAVVALIGFYEMPRRTRTEAPGRWSMVTLPLRDAAITSFIAGLATLVFSAYHFQQTAPLSVVGNILVLPVLSLVIMPFAVVSVLAMPLALEHWPLEIMGWGIERMLDIAALVAGWSEGWTGNPLLTGWALAITLAALAWFAFFPTLWRLIGPVAALPLLLLFGFAGRPDILVADTTQAVAVRTEDGLGMVTGRTGSFAVDAWSEHYQEEIAATAGGVHCDISGCIAATDRLASPLPAALTRCRRIAAAMTC